jgi:hypothetical protein
LLRNHQERGAEVIKLPKRTLQNSRTSSNFSLHKSAGLINVKKDVGATRITSYEAKTTL